MDSALRTRFLELLDWDLAALYLVNPDHTYLPVELGPNGFEWWPIYRRWWTGRDPRPVVRI